MKKRIYLDKQAKKELRQFPEKVQIKFEAYIIRLRQQGKLEFPESKKINNKLFELRVKIKNTYRGFYTYLGKTYIIILHFFKKKAQKTPLKNLKTAQRRLRQYE